MDIGRITIVEEIGSKAAEIILSVARDCIQSKDSFNIAISGGRTPISVFKNLSELINDLGLDTSKFHFFFTDERWVPSNHLDSNYNSAKINLFDKIAVTNVYPMVNDFLSLESSVKAYQEFLKTFFKLKKNQYPKFDLILLGIGTDGHVASLFPNSNELNSDEVCIKSESDSHKYSRLTLTLPSLNSSNFNLFICKGSTKLSLVKQLIGKTYNIPFSLIDFNKTNTEWLINE